MAECYAEKGDAERENAVRSEILRLVQAMQQQESNDGGDEAAAAAGDDADSDVDIKKAG
eukprot:CAMPEP_0170198156 /NCGR_PEP_ID=MMETSP0040_2-20121228/68093_1 /TAXON_ID=641309 /ORGANISM="Lotharella oceanica, Strain CCMP622" /LENGTH=58 /DNA_ID=CAMNT_0010448015 /DNA_START=44 /DNA_END=220 /DNA_ORIENTATION=+